MIGQGKESQVPMVSTEHMKEASTLTYETRFYITSQMKRPPVSRERHLQFNMSEKVLSISWKDLIIGTRKPGTCIRLCPLCKLHQ